MRSLENGAKLYMRSFVVARINPLRWIKGEPPSLEEVLKTMRALGLRLCFTTLLWSDSGMVGSI